jgi:aldehyde:ferredoxin oxidoreductase
LSTKEFKIEVEDKGEDIETIERNIITEYMKNEQEFKEFLPLIPNLNAILDTEKYEEFGGGHGIGSALFFDLAADQLPFEAFDPRNIVILTTSPFSGTYVPGSGRCEIQGLAPMYYPIEWFNRSNWGGRFTAQLKYAGWDGIVIEGAPIPPSGSTSSTTRSNLKTPMVSGGWILRIHRRRSCGV